MNYPNNLAMQSVRKYSKQVLFDDLVKKKYMCFDDMETGKIQDLFSEFIFLYTKFAVLLRSIYNSSIPLL